LWTIDDVTKKFQVIHKVDQKILNLECYQDISSSICFERLIKESYQKYNQKVVILIDEYDRPILDVVDDIEQAKINREFIKGLYSVMKGVDEYIQFAFLTGVSKFSKASVFSGLNMLEDITLTPKFGNICGYTQNNIENEFKIYLDGVDLNKVKEWYNGYNFLKDDVYNTFDLLQFIKNDYLFSNYWFATGTPTFLIKLIEKNNYFLSKLNNLIVGEQILDSFDIENLDLEVVLYQSGYLTIDKRIIDEDLDIIEYSLKLPNREVKQSFNDMIIKFIMDKSNYNIDKKNIIVSLKNKNLDDFKNAFIQIFSSIPYNNYTKSKLNQYEGFYASIVYVYLQSLGLDIIGEDVTNKGRIDLTIKFQDCIYIIEFKVGGDDALAQIKEKKYYEKYLDYKEIYLIGINFDEKDKNISKFEWEMIKWRVNLK